MDSETGFISSRLELPTLLNERRLEYEGAEVGVLFGDFSAHILKHWGGKLHMIDPWVQQDPEVYLDGCNAVSMNKAYERAKARVAPFSVRANLIRSFSLEASHGFRDGQLDFVYLDANHSFDSVSADLLAWWPKVRAGGIVAGHDFYERHDEYQNCGVESAVREFVQQRGLELKLTPECTSWWIDVPS